MARIDEHELEHFRRLQQEIRDAQTRFNGFMGFLTVKYQIGPGSALAPDGEIVQQLQTVPASEVMKPVQMKKRK